MRAKEPGWVRVVPYDKTKRRAVWVRVTSEAVELCAGREGDDAYARLPLDGDGTLQDLDGLAGVTDYGIANHPDRGVEP